MKKAIFTLVLASLVLTPRPTPAKMFSPLLYASNLTYQGAFRLPNDNGQYPNGFDYGGRGMTYYAANNSLILGGTTVYGYAAEISIPTPSTAGTVAALPRATLLQTWTDIFDGKRLTVDGSTGDGVHIGGLLPSGANLIANVYDYYDGSQTQTLSMFRSKLLFSTVPGNVLGPYRVGTPLYQAGFVSGWMTPIPAAWQSALGGPALTGNCCLSVIQRSSYGPSVTVFDPADVGVTDPVPGTRVLGYIAGHTTIGNYPNGALYNGVVWVGGMAFPSGSSSLIFFGRNSQDITGTYCYGESTQNPALHGTSIPGYPGEVYCYDPTIAAGDKGPHAWPYTFLAWAYDVNDLAAVKAGSKSYWEPVPYATWTFTLPFNYTDTKKIQGVAYDPATQRIFMTAEGQDSSTPGSGCCRPLVHVFSLSLLSGCAHLPTNQYLLLPGNSRRQFVCGEP